MVGVGVKVGRRNPVGEGGMVCEGAKVAVINGDPGVAVQVAGRRNKVGVELGITTCGGNVAGGNGFSMEVGATKMAVKRTASIQIASSPRMESTSQNEIFNCPISSVNIPSSVSISYFYPLSS